MAGPGFSQQAPGDKLHLSQDLMDVKLREEQLAMGKTSRIIAEQDILGPKLRITPLERTSLSKGEKELQRHMVATHMLSKQKQISSGRAASRDAVLKGSPSETDHTQDMYKPLAQSKCCWKL